MAIHLLKPALAPLILRVGLAAILLYHGLLKLGHDAGTDWSPDLGIPPEIQALVAWVELLSGIAIALGALTRFAAFAIAVIQIGAIILVTGHKDFISLQRLGPETRGYRFVAVGWEYNFAIVVMCLTLLMLGSGTWSLNSAILRLWRSRRPTPAA